MELELLDWLMWFALIPAGSALIFAGVLFFWLRHVLLTRTRVWLVTLALTLLFLIIELFVIFHFAYLLPG
ncbi:MAG: hypothetical protein K9K65_11095 [Desulfarculaceae bacterium]|nr:hypothetical protein [Desulfarculaceae bacterium]MCF8047606.1 hypothetical protein [Desulfarculaceae bacterium]MCF8066527.1 hypothetical protein [Desulfarculaceae bacterium]MCF8098380.1 hypothetical protein [Desulfarculaceae bacterium]MCF8123913.1 hypothetical protein [Desulfarculaceae bacterium]